MTRDEENDDIANESRSSEESIYEPEYEIEDCILIPNQFHFRVNCVVPPPLEYMSQLHSQNEEISGRQVWSGSMILSHFFIHNHHSSWKQKYQAQPNAATTSISRGVVLRGKRILELGGGTGLVSMVLAQLAVQEEVEPCSTSTGTILPSPCHITCTDGDETALELLQQNLTLDWNQTAMGQIMVESKFLQWNKDIPSFLESCRRQDDSQRGEDPDKGHFDMIVAGDVLYKMGLPQCFFQTVIQAFTKNAAATLWLCHVPRSTVTHDIVQQAAAEAGLEICNIWDATDLQTIIKEQLETFNDESTKVAQHDLDRAKVYRMVFKREVAREVM